MISGTRTATDIGDYGEEARRVGAALPLLWNEYGTARTAREVAVVLTNLGTAYGDLGDHAKERDMLERALAIKERAYGRDHPEVATTLTNLGNAYGQLGDHAKKRDMLERALAIEERAYGRDHPNVATTLTNLGNAYGGLGDHAKKRDVLERALAIEERAYGRDHPEVADHADEPRERAYGNLGDHAKKRDMLERALAIDERAYGRDHPEVGHHAVQSRHGLRARACLGDIANVALSARAPRTRPKARSWTRAYMVPTIRTRRCASMLAELRPCSPPQNLTFSPARRDDAAPSIRLIKRQLAQNNHRAPPSAPRHAVRLQRLRRQACRLLDQTGGSPASRTRGCTQDTSTT